MSGAPPPFPRVGSGGGAPGTRDLARLPKAHLHLHLEGAMRPTTLAELAAAHGMPVPHVRDYRTFAEFGLRYAEAAALIDTESALRRVVREVIEDAARDGAMGAPPRPSGPGGGSSPPSTRPPTPSGSASRPATSSPS